MSGIAGAAYLDTQDALAQARAALGAAVSGQQSLAAITTTNLFDPTSRDILYGYYVSNTGVLFTNQAYNTTGFMPVTADATYYQSYLLDTTRQVLPSNSNIVSWYDITKTFLSQTTAAPSAITAPANAAFARVSVRTSSSTWRGYQFSLGGTLPSTWTIYQAPYAPNPFQREILRQTHYRLLKRSLPTPESTQLVINLAGDSYTHSASRWAQPFAQILTSLYGDAGGGYSGFGFGLVGTTPYAVGGNQPSLINGNARPDLYPVTYVGSPTPTWYTAAVADLTSITLSTSGDEVQQGFPASPTISGVDLHFIGTSNGVIRYSFNNGSTWSTLNVQGTVGATQIAALSLTGYTAGSAGTLRIQWVSGTATLGGVNLKSAADGVRVNKLGSTGSGVAQWTSVDGANWQTSFANLGGHLTLYMTGPNDQAASVVPGFGGGQFGGNVAVLVNRFRGATTGGATSTAMDVLLIAPPENLRGGSNSLSIAAYAANMRELAYRTRTAFLDLQPAFGDPPSTYGSSGDVPLFNSDNLHPEPTTGGRLIAAEILRVVLPF